MIPRDTHNMGDCRVSVIQETLKVLGHTFYDGSFPGRGQVTGVNQDVAFRDGQLTVVTVRITHTHDVYNHRVCF